MAVVAGQLAMNPSKRFRHKHIDPAQQMRLWNTLIEVERIEELSLIGGLATHHQSVLLANHPENGITPTPRIQSTFSTASTRSISSEATAEVGFAPFLDVPGASPKPTFAFMQVSALATGHRGKTGWKHRKLVLQLSDGASAILRRPGHERTS